MVTVILHGLGQNASSWDFVQQSGYFGTVICPNLESLVERDVSFEKLYLEVEKIIKEINEPIHLVGLSLGAMLAIKYAIHHQNNIEKLVLIGAQFKIPKLVFLLQSFVFRLLPAQQFQKLGFTKENVIYLTQSMTHINMENELSNIESRTLIICGEKDKVNQKSSKQLHHLIRNSKLYIVAGATHEVNVSKPNELLQELKNFLSN